MSGTATNTLILKFKPSTPFLKQDNPIIPQVTAVNKRKERKGFKIKSLQLTEILETVIKHHIKLQPRRHQNIKVTQKN